MNNKTDMMKLKDSIDSDFDLFDLCDLSVDVDIDVDVGNKYEVKRKLSIMNIIKVMNTYNNIY